MLSAAGTYWSRCHTTRRKSNRQRPRSDHQPIAPPPGDPLVSAHGTAPVHRRPANIADGGRSGPPPPWPTKTSRRSAAAGPHGLCPATIPAAAEGGRGAWRGDGREGAVATQCGPTAAARERRAEGGNG
jgi:hypothetical protein